MTLIIDNKATADSLWDIYYHLYLDSPTTAIIRKQAEKLVPLLATLETWSDSKYGKALRFWDIDTLGDVRHVCQLVALAARDPSSHDRFKQFAERLKQTRTAYNRANGDNGINVTGMRSAAPLSLQSQMELPDAYARYWKQGTVTPKDQGVSLLNPMFASIVSPNAVLHYGTDPLLGFHLATVYGPLVDGSPLKPKDSHGPFKAASAAKVQFSEWASALRSLLRKGSMVRFVVSGVFSFCQTLQHTALTGA